MMYDDILTPNMLILQRFLGVRLWLTDSNTAELITAG